MNLTDIEKAVVELSFRHPGLTKEFLRTLLEASGWEEKHIKEAQIIYAAHMATASPAPQISQEQETSQVETSVVSNIPTPLPASDKLDDMTFLRADGTEEGELPVDVSVETKRREVEERAAHPVQNETVVEGEAPLPAPKEEVDVVMREANANHQEAVLAEEESLVKEDLPIREEKPKTWSELPDNLPLVPFESSPHIWSFGRYKDTFYQESKTEERKTETITTTTSYVQEKEQGSVSVPGAKPVATYQAPQPPEPVLPKSGAEIEIDFEKTPISKGEESLVVLAGIMLLAIMLILGYMYGNGRL